MPLHGKIVVIKRSGGDGTEFPLTATCLIGRKPGCDIRIQLPQVSKEHCRIDLNENKEVILTNLSSVNPTSVNGEVLQQSERLKHGDVITVIDRSFRFEYPPPPTPKKRSSVGGKNPLQGQQVAEKDITKSGEKTSSVVPADPPLKDGTNHDNIQRSMDRTTELESSETQSPFSDLYQMIKKSLDVKTPRKSSASLLQTPSSQFCTPRPVSVRKNGGNPVTSTGDDSAAKADESNVLPAATETKISTRPKSPQKRRDSARVPPSEMEKVQSVVQSEAASPLSVKCATPQKPPVSEGSEKDDAAVQKSPLRRRSKEATPAKPAVTSPKMELRRTSPRNSVKVQTVTSKKRKSGELATDLPLPKTKKKRVSFGINLSPELFDKRLPPDSPLRRGATPRRSLCVVKPKQSLLRRASVIGLVKVFENDSQDTGAAPSPSKSPSAKNTPQKSRSASPKAATPAKQSPKSRSASPKAATPAKQSPKSRSASPKATTPAKQSPKSRSASPKAATPAKQSPKSRSASPRAATPAKQSPKSRSASPKAATPAKKPQQSTSPSPAKGKSPPAYQTPTVQGRFSVSRISTPSPLEDTALTNEVPSETATPKLAPRRKSQSVKKSALKAKSRRSTISRVSMKALVSWADIVKFGKAKPQMAVPAKTRVIKGRAKKLAPKPKTPARKLEHMSSTGHANSPAAIVLGRAHSKKIIQPSGAAPQLITNTAILKKNMKMDEDLTGISEMYKTPVLKKRKSVVNESNTIKTPVELQSTLVEPSVLDTPEETGEMMVSPLSISSTIKEGQYSSEAVQRLFNEDHESSIAAEGSSAVPGEEDQLLPDLENSAATPKQKPQSMGCLTGVKRIMKTPKQRVEPVEDLRGKILKTPKQKSVQQQECLTGVKRIMKTPKQKAEPVEDLRGKILKTPKQKPVQQQECLTGVKRIMKTPKQKAEPVEDLRGKILKTPRQKLEAQDCLTGVKRIFNTPQAEGHPIGEAQDTQEVCSAVEMGEMNLDDVFEENVEATVDCEPQAEMTHVQTPSVKNSPPECLTGIKRMMRTPREKNAPVEDFVGVRRLMKTPKEKFDSVEEHFGIKRLVKTPRQIVGTPVEDFEGLKELMEEPQAEHSGQLETNEVEEQTLDCCDDTAQELNFDHEEQQSEAPDTLQTGAEGKVAANADGHKEQVPYEASNAADDESLPESEVNQMNDQVSEESPKLETTTGPEIEGAADPAPKRKPVRGRQAKNVDVETTQKKHEEGNISEGPVVPISVSGRRGKQIEATAPLPVRQTTRGRNAKAAAGANVAMETEKVKPQPAKVAPKPKRGRGVKPATSDQAEVTQDIEQAATVIESAAETCLSQETNDEAAPPEEVIVKPRRGRRLEKLVKNKLEDVPPANAEDLPQSVQTKETDSEVSTEHLDKSPGETEENKPSAAKDDSPQVTEEEEEVPHKVPEINAAVVEKKPVRGRRAKVVESKPHEDEVTEPSENVVLPSAVRGRRGKKAEAAAPPAVRQTRRGRNTNSEDQPEITAEAVTSDQKPTVEEEHVALPKEAVTRPTRGRKIKSPTEPPQPEQEKIPDVIEELPKEDAQPGRSRRGRQTTAVEQTEAAEDTSATASSEQPSEPPVRAKRGRNAKQGDEKPENKTAEIQEPVKKSRRTRKAEEDQVEQREEKTVETAVSVQTEAPGTVKETEQVNATAKPRRGGRKAKQTPESETPVEATDVEETPAVTTTEKPRRGRRAKTVTEEAEVTDVAPKKADCEPEEPEAVETTAEPDTPASRPSRGRQVKKPSSQVPTKRARRGAAPPESEPNAESTDQDSEMLVSSVQPPKRGRRAAAKPIVEDTVVSDQANSSECSKVSGVEDKQTTKKGIQWKTEVEVFEIPALTPVKVVRGRRPKAGSRVFSEIQDVQEKVCISEEKNLSDDAEPQPAKRAKRGSKSSDGPVDDDQSTSKKAVETEAQPKTRRGRSARK